MQKIQKIKAISKDFAPKIVPLINGLNAKFLENLQYPVFIQPFPSGVKIFIRSGFLRFADGRVITNLEFKEKIDILLKRSRRIKVTFECIVTGRYSEIDSREIESILCDYDGNVDDLQLYVADMLFEHSPESLEYSVRANSLTNFVNTKEVGPFPKVLKASIAYNVKDFESYITSYVMFEGFENFIIASPKSKYKFGDVEDLFHGDGGIAQIRGNSEFKAKIKEVIPRIVTIKNKDVFVASKLVVIYGRENIELDLDKQSIIVAAKTWENRKELSNHFAVFTGLLLPGYKYPKYRKFQRFERER